MRFKPGQEVVCTGATNGWTVEKLFFGFIRRKKVPGPAYNELCTVVRYGNPTGLVLKGYETFGNYEERHFEPVVPIEEIEIIFKEKEKTI